MPEPDVVTRSAGAGRSGLAPRRARISDARSVMAGFAGERLLPPVASAAKFTADGRGQTYSGRLNACATRHEPTTAPSTRARSPCRPSGASTAEAPSTTPA
jgi:hypothetical protein